MSADSKIEWTDYTFNPWWGCTKVSPGCDHCYAETLAKRFGHAVWGSGVPRRAFGLKHWTEPLRWNARAAKERKRPRVFCASMADVFDNEVPDSWRGRLFALIDETPELNWLLLTKRIGNVPKMVPYGHHGWPGHVWLGISVVNQEEAGRDIPKLLATPARVRFLSCEPLLGPMDLRHHLSGLSDEPRLHWVIVGGESGPKARPMHPDWARSLRDQCKAAGLPFFFKQWGEWLRTGSIDVYCHGPQRNEREYPNAPGIAWLADGRICLRDYTVAEHAERMRKGVAHNAAAEVVDRAALTAFHTSMEASDGPGNPLGYEWMYRVGKKAAGRTLDGREWNEAPAT